MREFTYTPDYSAVYGNIMSSIPLCVKNNTVFILKKTTTKNKKKKKKQQQQQYSTILWSVAREERVVSFNQTGQEWANGHHLKKKIKTKYV